MAGIYIHIPFCQQACYYCDFHFSTNRQSQLDICNAISQELEIQKDYLNSESVETIYLGGGTPSILQEQELALIFESIQKKYSVINTAEITLEANPDDLTIVKLRALKKMGINRLSIGVQSFDDVVLKFLNRSHTSGQARKCIESARDAGFSNISVDLIYAIPDHDADSLKKDLDCLLKLSPEHISAYSLTIEEKTVFGKWHQTKKLTPTSEDENANQFELVLNTLTSAGYDHYEISNYSRPGFISNHNSNYWRQKKYLGIGPSAHSFDGTTRQVNVSNNHTYLKSIRQNRIPATQEILTREEHINEYIMTSLRTSWGCDLNYLKSTHQYDLLTNQMAYINTAIEQGWITMNQNILRLTRAGKMHADKIASDLFLIL
jgi:oxygen-independent coproporphyrinogen-3 oxidase